MNMVGENDIFADDISVRRFPRLYQHMMKFLLRKYRFSIFGAHREEDNVRTVPRV